MLVQALSLRVEKRENAAQRIRFVRGKKLNGHRLYPIQTLTHQRIGMAGDIFHVHALYIGQCCIDRIHRGIIGHAHHKTLGPGFALCRPVKAVAAKGVLDIVPAAGRCCPLLCTLCRHANQAATMAAQNPLMGRTNDQIGTLQIQRDAA